MIPIFCSFENRVKKLSAPNFFFGILLLLSLISLLSCITVSSGHEVEPSLKKARDLNGRYDRNGNLPSRPSSSPDNVFFEPYFDRNAAHNVTAKLGKTASLLCTIHELGEGTVTWVRHEDLHILTIEKFTYITDPRFKSLNEEGSDIWSLVIEDTKESDSGIYECQVSTQGIETKKLQVHLSVIASKAKITEDRSLYVEIGSSITVHCEISKTIFPTEYIVWYHNKVLLKTGDRDNRIIIRTDHTTNEYSELSISDVHKSDSGEYSCKPSDGHQAKIYIDTLKGEETAAMQHEHRNSQVSLASSLESFFFVIPINIYFKFISD